MELLVLLADVPIGLLRSATDGRNEFRFVSDYLRLARRPVLGQYFEDHLAEVQRSRLSLPPFFSNLLPEGGLRELVARRAGVSPEREIEMIALLGGDLPGAVVVREHSGDHDFEEPEPLDEAEIAAGEQQLRFSLAGAQLKFSVLYREGGRGPTLPINGRGGDWIAKLPSETFEEVPENEFVVLNWARLVGIDVPKTALVRAGDIEGLPVRINPDRNVFLSRRFDRPTGGKRIHQEDFAQIANVRHAYRYEKLSYAGVARVVRAVAGEADFDEVVRRLAFNIVIGNGDAHLKNWSLWYPDTIQARLAPVYDLVATVTFIPADTLALRLSRENRFDAITVAHFERLAAKTGVPHERVVGIVRETIDRAMSTWPTELGARSNALRRHVDRLPLVAEVMKMRTRS